MARKINVKLILELREAGLSRSTIASSRHISRHSVSEVFSIADEKGIHFNDVRALEETGVYRLFYPEKFANETMYRDPDYEHVHQELKKVGVTLKLLHKEYIERCERRGEIPMGKTKFNEGYAEYTVANRLTNRIEHKPGERVEVDWSGPGMRYVDMSSGELITVYLFVGTLPYSQFAYVEPCLDMKMDTFIRCHIHMYEYLGGVPIRTVCDNLKTGVVAHPKDGEVLLTNDYAAMGSHYMTAIMPAGIRKPKQKASVEGTVGKIATAIIARCRNDVYHSFAELKKSVAEKLNQFNHAAFQKREGSRVELLMEERPYLRPLPDVPYEVAEWVYERAVNLDFLMNMGEFIEELEIQRQDPQTLALPFDERFQLLADSVYQRKYNDKVRRLIKNAKLRLPKADIHDILYLDKRPLNRGIIAELASCRFVEECRSIVFQGYSSSGKTFLGCAMAKEACRQLNKTKYIRLPDLLEEFAEKSLLPGGKNKVLNKYATYQVLVLDEWLMPDLSKEDVEFILELTERRYDSTSTIFCTLYKREDWVMRLRGGTYAESIVERFAHNTTWVEMGDMNMRQHLTHA